MSRAKTTRKTGTRLPVSRDKVVNELQKIFYAVSENKSKAIADPFEGDYSTHNNGFEVVEPPFNFNAVSKVLYENSTLIQCIAAMAINVHGHGYRLEFIGKQGHETEAAPIEELKRIESFFDHPNYEETFHQLRYKVGFDFYVFGNAYIEVVRNANNDIVAINHVPAYSVRLTARDEEPTTTRVELERNGKIERIKIQKRFRRYVQIYDATNKLFFKEFNDPRKVDPDTGQEDSDIALEDSATELIHISEYNSLSVYGVPHWYTQLPSILGSRQSELTNLDFFSKNAVPALAVLVSGGGLTAESAEALEDRFEEIRGRESVHNVLLLEARGAIEDAGSDGNVPQPRMDIKPLFNQRQGDAIFGKYDESAREKIRSVFRLPPIFIGLSADYSYASAKTSFEVAEGQIFAPERVKFDDIINNKIMPNFRPQYFRFRSNPPQLSTAEDKMKAIQAFNMAGALTPNNAIAMFNEVLNTDIPRFQQSWGDIPVRLIEKILQSYGGTDKINYVKELLDTVINDDLEPVVISEVGTEGTIISQGDKEAKPLGVSKDEE